MDPAAVVGYVATMNQLPDHDTDLLALFAGDTRIAPMRVFDPYVSNGTRFINFTVDEEHASAVLDANKDELRVYEVDPSHPEPRLICRVKWLAPVVPGKFWVSDLDADSPAVVGWKTTGKKKIAGGLTPPAGLEAPKRGRGGGKKGKK
ncbi:MAG: hypothetical protein Q8P41_26830 [Pseudomonadota bacterium]|nr:hypothetical protein [Pseudomonadota bacterium]